MKKDGMEKELIIHMMVKCCLKLNIKMEKIMKYK